MTLRQRFQLNWVLHGQLALGPAPRAPRHLDRLSDAGIRSVLSLCADSEVPDQEPGLTKEISHRFQHHRLVLPDHRSGRAPTAAELKEALDLADLALAAAPPLFVHCVAAMERSPLVCLALLMQKRGLSRLGALDYLQQVHPGTNPLPQQLALLNGLAP
ncbi:MAG: hypothetical protein RLZZ158_1500 [Cyanobacteriota bacterium]